MTVSHSATERDVGRPAPGAVEVPAGRTTGWWGMTLFISTEAATFAAVLASYFYLRFADENPWPPPGERLPDLWWPSLANGILVLSCVPMFLAVAAGRRTDVARGGPLLGVLLATLGGAAFMVFQVIDWMVEWPASTISENAYGSLFYSITGLHTVHVVIGLGMLMFLLASLALGRIGKGHAEPLAIVGMYWYFMGVVAVAVYLTVYVSPYL